MENEILTNLLKAFLAVFEQGAGRLLPDARWILLSLLTVELAVLGLWIAAGYDRHIAGSLITLTLKLTLYVALVTNWNLLVNALGKGFVALGLRASGETISSDTFTDPSNLAAFGVSAMKQVFNRIFQYTGWDAMWNLPDVLFTGAAAVACLIAFVVFGIQVFVTLLEFYCVAAIGVVLVPWGMLRQTTFLAEKAIAAVWAFAVKLLIQAFLAGAAMPSMLRLQPGLNPKLDQCVTLAIGGWALVAAAWRLPKVAMSLLQGSPHLTAHDVAQVAQTTGRMVWRTMAAARTLAPTPTTPTRARRPL